MEMKEKVFLAVYILLFSTLVGILPVAAANPLWIEAGGPYYGLVDDPIHFYLDIQGGTSPYTVHWDFGDGETSKVRYSDHIYYQSGNYLVTVTVVDHVGTKVMDYTTAFVYDTLLVNLYESSGYIGEEISIHCEVTGGKPPYDIWWDVDGDNLFDDGIGELITYCWHAPGVYTVRVKVHDDLGNEVVGCSNVTISKKNNSPEIPMKPAGSTEGKIDTDYTYYTSTRDPEDDDLYVQWDFGEGVLSDWFGPFESNQNISVSHRWTREGNYEIKVRAKDDLGLTSEWSEGLITKVSKVKHLSYPRVPILSYVKHHLFYLWQMAGGYFSLS